MFLHAAAGLPKQHSSLAVLEGQQQHEGANMPAQQDSCAGIFTENSILIPPPPPQTQFCCSSKNVGPTFLAVAHAQVSQMCVLYLIAR